MMAGGTDVMDALDAAAFLGVHVETIRRLARRGEIPSFKVGKDWRFRRDALERWSDTQRAGGKPALVMTVDDEIEVCRTICRMVQRLGYSALHATDGEAGLKLLSRDVPGLILLDLAMPGMSGVEFLRELRATHPELPVAIVTGRPDSDLMVEAMKYGPLMIVSKPVAEQQLKRALQMAMGQSMQAK
jgi:excisionase family DNA binding protein